MITPYKVEREEYSMKCFWNGKMRWLSLLLSLVLAVGLIQTNAVAVSA